MLVYMTLKPVKLTPRYSIWVSLEALKTNLLKKILSKIRLFWDRKCSTVSFWLGLYTYNSPPLQKSTTVPCINHILNGVWREQPFAAEKPEQPVRSQRPLIVTLLSSISSKNSAGLGEFFEPNAFRMSGNKQTQLTLPSGGALQEDLSRLLSWG